jgi:hypothetical protein
VWSWKSSRNNLGSNGVVVCLMTTPHWGRST